MQIKNYNVTLRVSTLFLLCFSLIALAEYVEGIDTTDENGYGLDSLFRVASDGRIYAENSLPYGLMHGESGYFNYSFNDLKIVAIKNYNYFQINPEEIKFTCFIVKKKDSTYTKVQLLNTISNNRYVFKHGSNTTPKDRILEKSDYDRSVRYKPNNVTYHFYYRTPPDTLIWEPPLPNSNHLVGYVLYQTKQNAAIDTTKPINIAQWDSVAFSNDTLSAYQFWPGCYLNIVSVYTEGKSDFLQGWTLYMPTSDDLKNHSGRQKKRCSKIVFANGIYFTPQPDFKGAILSIYNVAGKRIAFFSNSSGNRILWNTSQHNIPVGLYLLRAEFPDRSVIMQPFTVTR